MPLDPETRWYVGAQNDTLFILDKPPRPVPTDHLGDHLTVNVIAKVYQQDRHEVEVAYADVLAAAPALLAACRDALAIGIIDPRVRKLVVEAIAAAEGGAGVPIRPSADSECQALLADLRSLYERSQQLHERMKCQGRDAGIWETMHGLRQALARADMQLGPPAPASPPDETTHCYLPDGKGEAWTAEDILRQEA